jgi:hypothetical protein
LLEKQFRDEQLLLCRQGDLRAYRITEAVLRAAGAKEVMAPEKMFPSLGNLNMEDTSQEVDPEDSFEQLKHVLSAMGR